MATTSVSLQEVLSAIGGPLEEQSLWALLRQTTKSLAKALQGRDSTAELLITPESTLLFHGGEVKFLQGISGTLHQIYSCLTTALGSAYTAPELIIANGDLQGKENKEKSYIYSLGTTLFTAMQFELESGKEPLVSAQLNKILLKMVEESVEERATFDDVNEACRQRELESTSVGEEINKLVIYVMGTAPELSSSEYGDTDMDDANLESEFQQAMMIQPTGSVEQLYSPSYGSRASSSLSLNSSGNRSDINANFHSSLPVVYCSSQERLGFKNGGRRGPRPRWSSHDRLLSPLLCADIEALASKDKRQPVGEPVGHTHYPSHLYTPKRTRRDKVPPDNVTVERSASFHATGIYRTSSDGVSRSSGERPGGVQQPPVQMTTFNLDDMPVLPPQTTREAITVSPDVSLDPDVSLGPEVSLNPDVSLSPDVYLHPDVSLGPDVSQDTSTSLTAEDDRSAATPPVPYSEPPILSPLAKDDGSASTETPPTDATFDYNDISENGRSNSSHGDNEFDFSLSDSPPPPPPPISTLPLDEQTPPTTPAQGNISMISPPGDEAPPTPPTSPPYEEAPPNPPTSPSNEEAPPTPPTSPPYEEAPPTPPTCPPYEEAVVTGGELSPSSMPCAGDTESVEHFERRLTPRTALAKAFEDLDKVCINKLTDDDESHEGGSREGLDNKEGGVGEESDERGLDHLYAKVDKTKKKGNRDTEGDEGREASPGQEGRMRGHEGADNLFYTKEDLTKKRRHQESLEKSGGEEIEMATLKLEVVHKTASSEDIMGPDYAEVHHPKRSSMPPSSSPTHNKSSYATIKPISLPPAASTKPHPPSLQVAVAADDELHPPEGKLYEVTSNDMIGRRNQRSIRKLGVMFGPEFKNLSGLHTLNKPKSVKGRGEGVASVKVVPEGRRIVRVIMLNGRQVPFIVERNSLCVELFEQVLSHQSLQEKRFFALAISKDWDEIFLEMDCRLSKYAPPGWASTPVPPPGSKGQRPSKFIVFFRVKFYVENINDLKFAQTRHLYYLQLRKDLLEGKTYCHDQPALKMASFALQAEKGDMPSKRQPYFRMEDYVPLKVMEKVGKKTIEELLPNMHDELKGMKREEAELEFLKEAQKLPEYGMVFYRVAKGKSDSIGSVWLGFCVRGIVVYDYHKNVKTPLHYCSWKKTQNLSFSNRKFIIELQDSKPLHFYTNSYKKARYLLHLSMNYHSFQLTSRGHLPHETDLALSQAEKVTYSREKETSFSQSPNDLVDVSHDQRTSSHDSFQKLSVRLLKDVSKGLGINIVDLKESSGESSAGRSSRIAIESVIKGGPADMDGKLKRGDVVVSVNGRSLEGLSRLEASDLIKNSVDIVDLVVLRDERSIVPFREPSLQEMTSAVIEEPEDHTHLTSDDRSRAVREKYPDLPEGETFVVKVKKEDGSFGLRIAGGKGKPFGGGFVYVKLLIKDTPAEKCHQLKERDIILKINGRELLDVTHREVASLITTATSDFVELVIHRPTSSIWLESSHEVYMSLQRGKGVRKREVSWTDLDPWTKQQLAKTLSSIKERGNSSRDEDGVVAETDALQESESTGEQPHLPDKEPLSMEEEDELPCLPPDGPPSLIEDETQELPQGDENMSHDLSLPKEAELLADRTSIEAAQQLEDSDSYPSMPLQGESLLPPEEVHLQEEPPLPPEEEAPLPPQGEPPLLLSDEEKEESSFNSDLESISSEATPDHEVRVQSPHSPPALSVDEELATSVGESSEFTVTESRVTSEVFSKSSLDKSSKDDSFHLSASFDEAASDVFTVHLKKGFRGLGFMLNKQRSLAEGGVFIGVIEADPAKSDGRLKPGDQIIEVDDESLEGLTYKDALSLLRQTEGLVELVVMRPKQNDIILPAPPSSPLPATDEDNPRPLAGAGDSGYLPPLPSTPVPQEDS